jgi:hypothetical protein
VYGHIFGTAFTGPTQYFLNRHIKSVSEFNGQRSYFDKNRDLLCCMSAACGHSSLLATQLSCVTCINSFQNIILSYNSFSCKHRDQPCRQASGTDAHFCSTSIPVQSSESVTAKLSNACVPDDSVRIYRLARWHSSVKTIKCRGFQSASELYRLTDRHW